MLVFKDSNWLKILNGVASFTQEFLFIRSAPGYLTLRAVISLPISRQRANRSAVFRYVVLLFENATYLHIFFFIVG